MLDVARAVLEIVKECLGGMYSLGECLVVGGKGDVIAHRGGDVAHNKGIVALVGG